MTNRSSFLRSKPLEGWPLLVICVLIHGCRERIMETPSPGYDAILLVTLDTTRADRLGLEWDAAATPVLDQLAARGRRFTRAYATAPMTLPAHTSMMTGLYAAEHGIHENGRQLSGDLPLLAPQLHARGYATAAFVSAFPLAGEFGLAEGFQVYDDDFGGERAERTADETTDRALAFLGGFEGEKLFLWVHYFDPHHPYSPPEPFRTRYAETPYLGEIAFMDRELGRLLDAFQAHFARHRILVVGDHGEGLGEHGENFHGRLLYRGVMRVPLIVAGADVTPAVVERPVSIREVRHTIAAWSSGDSRDGLAAYADAEIVLAEAMKPYLQYGWQPQVMAIEGSLKYIKAGQWEIYDLASDPGETRNLYPGKSPPASVETAVSNYVLPGDEKNGQGLSEERAERLASLGYAGSLGVTQAETRPIPREMTRHFPDLDLGSDLFVQSRYAQAVAVFGRVFGEDPGNLMACLRLAVAHSHLGEEDRALVYFERAGVLSPDSVDVRHYLGMHFFRFQRWDRAAEQFEIVLQHLPRKVAALECLAQIREREGNHREALKYYQRLVQLKKEGPIFVKLGNLHMSQGETGPAIRAFETAQNLLGSRFGHQLELGVCYLAAKRYRDAANQLERVPANHPGYGMALFKRAQAGALLHEPDTRERVRTAWNHADPSLRALMSRDVLLAPFLPQ